MAKAQDDSSDASSSMKVVVAGGGISGLYCAMQLADKGYDVTVLEATNKWGGRIETHRLKGSDNQPFPYPAEFGPMRFELEISPLFKKLLNQLEIVVTKFPSPLSPPIPIEYPVANDERELNTGKPLKPVELLKLGVFRMVGFHPHVADDQVILPLEEEHRFAKWGDDSANSADRFDALRKNAELSLNSITKKTRKLHDMGFWNALQEVLSPGAVSAINHLGTFYHLMPDNPSAIEWAIFWLRLFGPDSKLSTIPEGVNVVTWRLTERLQSPQYKERVTLRLGVRVTGLKPGEGSKVLVEYEDGKGAAQTLETDHVVLALPKVPLKRLSSFFPDEIRKDLDRVVAFSLLKVFIVMNTPERWKFAPPRTQENVWLFPTREVHYFVDGPANKTMVLLYTDTPAASFWQPYVRNPDEHHLAEIDDNEYLELVLWRRLEHLHFSWAEQRLRADAKGTETRRSDKSLFERYASASERVERGILAGMWRFALKTRMDDLTHVLALLLERAYEATSSQELGQLNQAGLLKFAKRLNLMSVFLSEKERILLNGDQEGVNDVHTPDDLVRQLIEIRLKLFAIEIFENPESVGADLGSSLGSYGIRDWVSDTHIGAGCHAWRPESKSWEVRHRLKAFGTHDRPDIKNVHICGEAYSDYQGFIEGALRSARDAMQAIVDADLQ